MLQQVFDILWEAAQDAAQRISDFFRRIGEWAKEVSQKVLRAYAGNMAILYGLATEKQIRLMYHRRPRIRFLSTPSARRATAKTETKSLFSNKLYNILHEFRRALIYNGSKSYPNHAK